MSSSLKGIKLSDERGAKLSAATTTLTGVPVIVKNHITFEILEYTSLTEAAKAIV